MNILYITHYTSLYGANKSLLRMMDQMILKGLTPFVILPLIEERGLIAELEKKALNMLHFSILSGCILIKKVFSIN
jgi:hypothetical protein